RPTDRTRIYNPNEASLSRNDPSDSDPAPGMSSGGPMRHSDGPARAQYEQIFGLARIVPPMLSGTGMSSFPQGPFRDLIPSWLDRALVLKAASFALIGFVNTLVDFAVFSLGYFYFGLPII